MRRAASLLCLLSLLAACRNAPERPAASATTAAIPTYTEDVAPILFTRCATCHRPLDSTQRSRGSLDPPAVRSRGSLDPPPGTARGSGSSDPGPSDDPLCVAGAPFSVLDYLSVARRAKAIASAVEQRRMPPWLPEPGHGDFINERRLADAEIATITRWASHGALEGDPAKKPAIPAFP